MMIGRRVWAVLVAVAVSVLLAAPARAERSRPACTLSGQGTVYCEGSTTPVRIGVAGRVVQLVAAGDSTCALTEPGAVYCWDASRPPERRAGVNPLLLVAIGTMLLAGGSALLLVSRS
jgi:hypothetical protein